ncbi:MAG: DUF2135 domain-containing protein [Polyangiales bacterium]
MSTAPAHRHPVVAMVIYLVAAQALAGCTVHSSKNEGTTPATQAQPAAHEAAPQPVTPVEGNSASVGDGVAVVDATCNPAAQEKCNAIDDNCNGQIDEGCGYQSGSVQVTLSWNTEADLDMYLTDPKGEVLSFQHKRSASGGFLDHDARGRCRPSQKIRNVENVFWKSDPPKGKYKVEVHYWGECNTGAGQTTGTVSVSVGGKVIGTYNATLVQGQRLQLTSFQVK